MRYDNQLPTFSVVTRVCLLLIATLLLSSCDESKNDDLRGYIKNVHKRPGGPVEPIPQVHTYKKFVYPKGKRRNPFKPIVTAKRFVASGPDRKRPKQPLEAYPLDGLRYVGHLRRNQHLWALVAAPDGIIHRIEVGSYLGKNYGHLKHIGKKELRIVETIPGPEGWQKRKAKLTLVE